MPCVWHLTCCMWEQARCSVCGVPYILLVPWKHTDANLEGAGTANIPCYDLRFWWRGRRGHDGCAQAEREDAAVAWRAAAHAAQALQDKTTEAEDLQQKLGRLVQASQQAMAAKEQLFAQRIACAKVGPAPPRQLMGGASTPLFHVFMHRCMDVGLCAVTWTWQGRSVLASRRPQVSRQGSEFRCTRPAPESHGQNQCCRCTPVTHGDRFRTHIHQSSCFTKPEGAP